MMEKERLCKYILPFISDLWLTLQVFLRGRAYGRDLPTLLHMLDPKKDETLLDIGAGTGFIASRVGRLCENVYALEPDYNKVEFIKRKFPEVKAFTASSDRIPFPESYFDKTYAIAAFHHFSNQEESLEEIARVTKRGGVLLLQDLDREKMSCSPREDERMVRERLSFPTPSELKSLAEMHGFIEEQVKPGHSGFFFLAKKE
jgi:ubiquinone/menaquinone biosynthesis C-methylase UbiE